MADVDNKTIASKKNKSSKKNKDLDSKKMTAQAKTIEARGLKIRGPIKLAVVILSVLALSWFFEGLRQVSHSPTLEHILILVSGTIGTALLLWLQGFWIYIEEKSKGTLRKKIVHFDKLQEYIENKFKSQSRSNKG